MNGQKRLAVTPELDKQSDTAPLSSNGDVERYIDLGEPNLGVPPDEAGADRIEPNSWQSRAMFQIHACRMKNQSASGMCLHVTKPSSLQVHVGDVVAAQEPNVTKWRVGVVRWLRCLSEEAMDLGIEMLGPEARAVAVKRESPPLYFEGLLLPGNRALNSPTSLIVSLGTNQPGEKLFVIDVDGVPRAVTPLRLMEHTASFSQLLLAPPPRD